jgi:hypothetical protein
MAGRGSVVGTLGTAGGESSVPPIPLTPDAAPGRTLSPNPGYDPGGVAGQGRVRSRGGAVVVCSSGACTLTNYVKAGDEVFLFDDRLDEDRASAVVFCEDRSPRCRPRGAAWRPWQGMPVWIRVVGA